MNKMIKVAIPVASLAIALTAGCKKEEPAPSAPAPQPQTQAQPAPAAPAPAQAQAPTPGGFSTAAPAALAGKTPAPGGKANLDAINKSGDKVVSVTGEQGLDINGWAFDPKTKSAPDSVIIELKPKTGDSYYAEAKRSPRGDLAKTFKTEAYAKAGYNLKADIKAVPAGEYEVNVIQIVDGNPVVAPTGKKIQKTS